MIRRVAIAGLILAALIAPLPVAAPASAGSNVGCTGSTCSVLLSSLITLNGDWGATGSAQVQVPLVQPPCLWQPIGDTTAGSNYIIQQFGAVPPGTPFGVYQSVQTARTLLKDKPVPPGTWYQLPINTAASQAAQNTCRALPLFAFAPLGQLPPAPPVPPRTLAGYAYNHMTIPAPTVTINPAAKGYVNLATYAWATTRPQSVITNQPNAYEVTATLGNQTVSVWAQLARKGTLTVGVTGPGTAYSAGCRAAGSRYRVGHVPASSGAGTPPDCGALWQGPTAAASLSATVRWTVTWGVGVLNGPGPRRLPAIAMTGRTPAFPVAEIQSINGG